MTPQAFTAKWRDNPLTERAGAQAHFEDLCALLEVEPPRVEGEYQYERGLIKKSSASQGWADVWKRGCFAWEYKAPDKDLGAALKQAVITRADDTTFGILHSRFHERWSLRLGTSLEDRPRYTPTTTFETFPFPTGLTPRDTASPSPQSSPLKGEGAMRIATAAKQLDALRETWLNPPEWVDWVRTKEEEQAGFPLRPVAKPGFDAELKKRTLTNLYNARPAWLDHAHRELDAAVAAAYGWTDYTPEMPDEEILRRLLALNLERAEIEHQLIAGRKIMKERHTVLRELAK